MFRRSGTGEMLPRESRSPDLAERLGRFPWGLLLLLLMVAGYGLVVLYSAAGGESGWPMVWKQLLRLGFAVAIMGGVAMASEKFYRRYAYVFYVVVLMMLMAVVVIGNVAMGARRWLDIGFLNLQPSELMKVAAILVLARYFHDRSLTKVLGLREIWVPGLLIGIPAVLILKQPDLGTAVLVVFIGLVVMFVAGLSWRTILIMTALTAAALPAAWSAMHDYQRRRILTLFDPERDPLGSGYHIIQSKIAVGSGGMGGKGFLGGSQSHLDFLPEQHTDFIFSVLAEEWGFVGAMVLMGLYTLIILKGVVVAATAKDRFGLLLATGVTTLLAVQVVINLGMVIGLLPVVGVPLPLVSYGGSSMLTVMLAMGLLANVDIHGKLTGR